MKTNKLIIYAAIGVGLWLLFRKKKVENTDVPQPIFGPVNPD